MSSGSVPRRTKAPSDMKRAACTSGGSNGGSSTPPNPHTPAQKRPPAAKQSRVDADGEGGGGSGGGDVPAVYKLKGGRHTVKKFFSKSRDEDDLRIGVPHWRRVLSNFYPVDLDIHGRRYATVEHALHAAKARLCSDRPSISDEFEVGGCVGSDPQKAKSTGGRTGFERFGATLDRSAWSRECDAATLEALRCRLAQDPLFRRVLVATHEQRIFLLHVDRSGARSYWGGSVSKTTGEVVGRNKLGYMLMDLAAEAVGAASQCEVDASSPQNDAVFGGGIRPAKMARVNDGGKFRRQARRR